MWQAPNRWADSRSVLAIVAFAGLSLLVLAVALLAPLRPQGGDTVPGRLSMVTLACEGRSDLATIDWLFANARQGKLPYYARVSEDERSIVSAFGPGPGWLGWGFFEDVRPGSVIDDQLIRERARIAACAAYACSTFLLALGLLAVVDWRWAVAGAATASLSFAGAASLAQGLWQQTAALPFYSLGIAAALWCRRRPRLIAVAALSAVTGCWLRPPDVLLALGIVLMAGLRAGIRELSGATVALTLIGATVLSVAFGAWNLWYFGSFLPVAQWRANELMMSQVFALEPRHVVTGLCGLFASPGRGILWFAPIVPLGLWLALRGRGSERAPARVLVAAIVVHDSNRRCSPRVRKEVKVNEVAAAIDWDLRSRVPFYGAIATKPNPLTCQSLQWTTRSRKKAASSAKSVIAATAGISRVRQGFFHC